MPKYKKETEDYFKSRIRSVMVVNPTASLREIQSTLQNSRAAPLKLHLQYIHKLQGKIVKERRVRNERADKSTRIAYIQDKKARIDQQLWKEATNEDNPGNVRVQALGLLLKNEMELLNAEMDAGVFERNLGVMEHVPKPLNAAQRARAVEVLATWGIVKKPNLNDQKQLPQPDDGTGGGNDSGGPGVEEGTA